MGPPRRRPASGCGRSSTTTSGWFATSISHRGSPRRQMGAAGDGPGRALVAADTAHARPGGDHGPIGRHDARELLRAAPRHGDARQGSQRAQRCDRRYMVEAVEAHEHVHEEHLLPAVHSAVDLIVAARIASRWAEQGLARPAEQRTTQRRRSARRRADQAGRAGRNGFSTGVSARLPPAVAAQHPYQRERRSAQPRRLHPGSGNSAHSSGVAQPHPCATSSHPFIAPSALEQRLDLVELAAPTASVCAPTRPSPSSMPADELLDLARA